MPCELPPHRLSCALGVSHPFDALLPSRPAELISSRSRSWGFPFEALIPPERRTFSRTPLPSHGWMQRERHIAVSGLCSSRRSRT